MDTKAQINDPVVRIARIVDRALSCIFLVAQPLVAVAQFLFIDLTASDWPDGTLALPRWAATTAIILVFVIPFAAAAVTVAMLAKRRLACWILLFALMLTCFVVAHAEKYGQTPDVL